MGARTDKIIGRSKQALGAVTGNKRLKREGQRQEDKGKLKAQVDSTIGKTQDALEDLKDKADRGKLTDCGRIGPRKPLSGR